MKRLIIGIVVIGLILVVIWFLPSKLAINEMKYDGAPLNIAVIGDVLM